MVVVRLKGLDYMSSNPGRDYISQTIKTIEACVNQTILSLAIGYLQGLYKREKVTCLKEKVWIQRC